MDWVEVLLAVIYMLYVVAPMARDELALRIILLVTSLGFVVWGYLVDERVTVVANVIFVAVSLRHILRLSEQRKPIELTDEQNLIFNSLFSSMTPREFMTLWQLGEPSTAPAGDLIVRGDVVADVLVVIDRDVVVELDTGARIAPAPSILGEMSYAIGGAATASATVRLEEPARIMRWTKARLRDLEQTHPELAVPFLASLGANLAKKVRL